MVYLISFRLVRNLSQGSKLKMLLSLFPIVFLIHDGEEVIKMEGWIKLHSDYLYGRVPDHIHFLVDAVQMSTNQFAVAVAFLFTFISLFTFLAVRNIQSKARMTIYLATLTMLFLNGFTHIAQSVFFQGYTPGVVTSIAVAIPYGLFVYMSLFKAGLLSWNNFKRIIVLMVLLIPIVPIAQVLGKILV